MLTCFISRRVHRLHSVTKFHIIYKGEILVADYNTASLYRPNRNNKMNKLIKIAAGYCALFGTQMFGAQMASACGGFFCQLTPIDQAGEQEMLVTLAIHLLLILIEYKPPSFDNLNFLIRGGHISLNKVF